MFPKWGLIIFATIALIANAGTIGQVTSENHTAHEKLKIVAKAVAETPEKTDDYLSQSINQATTAEEPSAKRYAYLMIFASGVAFAMIFNFFYKLVRWLINLIKAPSSRERGSTMALLITAILLFALTGYTFVRTIVGMG